MVKTRSRAASFITVRKMIKRDSLGSPFLQVEHLDIGEGETVVITGMDEVRAEILLHTMTGRLLPDEGEVVLFGVPTATIRDLDDWLPHLERMALLDPRQPLLEEWPVEISILYPYAMDLREPMDETRREKIRQRAMRFGLSEADLALPMSEADARIRLCVHFLKSTARIPDILFIMAYKDRIHPSHHEMLVCHLKSWKDRKTTVIFTDHVTAFQKVCSRILVYERRQGTFVEKQIGGTANWKRLFGRHPESG